MVAVQPDPRADVPRREPPSGSCSSANDGRNRVLATHCVVDVYLQTQRLLLRRFTAHDAERLVELDSDPEVMHFVTGGVPSSPDEIRDEVLPAFLAYYERTDGYGFWAAEDRASGAFLGWFHLRPSAGDAADEPELGYRLRRSAWGRGLATEGSRALVAKAFAELGARRVHAETMTVHHASRAVMERAGLRYVRTFHQDWPHPIPGDELGDVEYALTAEEFHAAQRAESNAE
jgi:RimJ/RimL family protein N-acetyltransferase